jgi:hypothetical protein
MVVRQLLRFSVEAYPNSACSFRTPARTPQEIAARLRPAALGAAGFLEITTRNTHPARDLHLCLHGNGGGVPRIL